MAYNFVVAAVKANGEPTHALPVLIESQILSARASTLDLQATRVADVKPNFSRPLICLVNAEFFAADGRDFLWSPWWVPNQEDIRISHAWQNADSLFSLSCKGWPHAAAWSGESHLH